MRKNKMCMMGVIMGTMLLAGCQSNREQMPAVTTGPAVQTESATTQETGSVSETTKAEQTENMENTVEAGVSQPETGVLSGGTGGAAPANKGSNAPLKEAGITLEQAAQKALTDAGLSENQVTFVKKKSDYDDGIQVYDIEFVTNDTKYEYEINTSDGSIRESSKKAITNTPEQSQSGIISLEEAKKTALRHAGVSEEQAVFTKAKLDQDDGISLYEIEFVVNNTEYEYDIKASDGSVLKSKQEAVKNAVSQTTAAAGIDLEAAKKAALSHAGFQESQVVFTKAKLDSDDNQPEYEIEFKVNGMEYEYTISAADGSIIEYEMDED